MKRLDLLIIVLLAGTTCDSAEVTADYYVSPRGADAWSGMLASPNAQGTDGPFATLERARDAVRQLKKRKSTDIAVLIRDGTYRLHETIVFGLEDSGQGNQTVTYAAYPGEKPVFSSGEQIRGWKKVTGRLPGLPRTAQGHVWVAEVSGRFLTLYDKEGLLPRARSAGFFPLDGGSKNVLRFPEGRLKNWPNIEDVEIVIRPHHAWILNMLPLVSVDEKAGIAHTAVDATYAMDRLHFLKDTENCWVENVLEALDDPGECPRPWRTFCGAVRVHCIRIHFFHFRGLRSPLSPQPRYA